jgi:hypothetical protein
MASKPRRTKSQEILGLIKRPVMVYLDPPQADALKALSARHGRPQQQFLREGLEYILKKYGGK